MNTEDLMDKLQQIVDEIKMDTKYHENDILATTVLILQALIDTIGEYEDAN